MYVRNAQRKLQFVQNTELKEKAAEPRFRHVSVSCTLFRRVSVSCTLLSLVRRNILNNVFFCIFLNRVLQIFLLDYCKGLDEELEFRLYKLDKNEIKDKLVEDRQEEDSSTGNGYEELDKSLLFASCSVNLSFLAAAAGTSGSAPREAKLPMKYLVRK